MWFGQFWGREESNLWTIFELTKTEERSRSGSNLWFTKWVSGVCDLRKLPVCHFDPFCAQKCWWRRDFWDLFMHFVIGFALGSGENNRLLSWQAVFWESAALGRSSEPIWRALPLNSVPISEVLAAASKRQQPQLLGFLRAWKPSSSTSPYKRCRWKRCNGLVVELGYLSCSKWGESHFHGDWLAKLEQVCADGMEG